MFKRVKTREYIMAVARPGVQKLNIPKLQSPKASIAANLGSASRSTGVSYGIFAQRTLTGSGIHLNNRAFNGASISATRHALNDNRTALFNNIGMPHRCNHDQGNNTMNKFMAGMMAMNMLAQMGAQTAAIIKEAKANRTEKPDNTPKSEAPNSPSNQTVTPGGSNPTEGTLSLSDRLKGAGTFTEIKDIESEIGTKLSGFNTEYQKIGKDESGNSLIQQTIAEINEGIQIAGVTQDLTVPTLSVISLSADSDITAIDTAISTIDDTDLKNINTYSGTIDKAVKSLKDKSGELGRSIDTLQKQLDRTPENDPGRASIQTQLDNLKAQKEKVDKAKETLETTVKQQIQDIKDGLEAKKNELKELKKTKENLVNKKYELAKSQMNTLTENARTMRTLKREIDGLRGKTEKADINKLRQKIDEYNRYIPAMAEAYNSLAALGNELQNIKDAKGNKLTNVPATGITTYKEFITPITQIPVAGAGSDVTTLQAGNVLGDRASVISLGEHTYVQDNNGDFVDETGKVTNRAEFLALALQHGVQVPEQPAQSAFNIELTPSFGGGANSKGLSGLGAGAFNMPDFNMPEFKPEGTITIGNKKYFPLDQNTYLSEDGQKISKELVFRLQMAQFAPRTEES